MKILIVNADYPSFLTWFYDANPGLAERSYDEQMRARNDSLFGVADFYSSNLRKDGHEAWEVHANNDIMQTAWAREHGMKLRSRSLLKTAKRLAATTPLRYLGPLLKPVAILRDSFSVLAAQVKHHRPDILLNQAMDTVTDDFLWEMKPYTRAVVGQIAAPLGDGSFRSYDMVISSLPNFVEYFRDKGIPSALSRLAFEGSILRRLKEQPKMTDVSFVGSISDDHSTRARLLEKICASVDVAWWGQKAASLPADSIILKQHRGTAWGLEMYQVLKDSKITLNHHIDIAGKYANNMRLFEATGVGTLLVTDRKDNLAEVFDPCKEVAVYGSADECVEVVRHYLDHDSERETIARAGQNRTLRDHSYEARMQELGEILRGCVAA